MHTFENPIIEGFLNLGEVLRTFSNVDISRVTGTWAKFCVLFTHLEDLAILISIFDYKPETTLLSDKLWW